MLGLIEARIRVRPPCGSVSSGSTSANFEVKRSSTAASILPKQEIAVERERVRGSVRAGRCSRRPRMLFPRAHGGVTPIVQMKGRPPVTATVAPVV